MPVEAAAVAFSNISSGSLLQAGAILASAAGVIGVILSNRAIARKRAILDFVIKAQTDHDMLTARKKFVELKQAGQMEKYAGNDQLPSDEASTIRFILNMYEVVAIGIKADAFDETIFHDWCRTTLVKDWMASKAFVAQYQREQNAKIYIGLRTWQSVGPIAKKKSICSPGQVRVFRAPRPPYLFARVLNLLPLRSV